MKLQVVHWLEPDGRHVALLDTLDLELIPLEAIKKVQAISLDDTPPPPVRGLIALINECHPSHSEERWALATALSYFLKCGILEIQPPRSTQELP